MRSQEILPILLRNDHIDRCAVAEYGCSGVFELAVELADLAHAAPVEIYPKLSALHHEAHLQFGYLEAQLVHAHPAERLAGVSRQRIGKVDGPTYLGAAGLWMHHREFCIKVFPGERWRTDDTPPMFLLRALLLDSEGVVHHGDADEKA